MAATNFTPIQLYYSTVASAVPTAANLAQGELAINIADGKLYYEDGSGVVQVIASKGAGTIGGSNTQVQYNNAGALAGSVNLTFNGTTLTANTLNLTNALGATYGGTGLTSYTTGDLLYSSASNTLAKLAIGPATYILSVNSGGTNVEWAAPSSISVNTATNLAGGVAGSVPYQSAAATTTFLAIGAANRVMTSTGTAPQWVTSLTSLTGVSSSSITNTSLTSGRVVYSGASGLQTDSASLTFNGTTLSAGGFSTTGLSTLVKTVTVGNSNFDGSAAFAPATPAKLYIGTGTVTDISTSVGGNVVTGAISSLAITPIAAANSGVTYTNAATLYIAGAPSAVAPLAITNAYALYVNAGTSYFDGNVGIGTSSPANKLTVKPSGTSNATFDVLTGSTNTDSVRISGGGTVNTWLEMRGYLGVKLYSDATNTVTVDTNGNMGLGVTPSLSTSNYRTLQIGGSPKFSIFGQRVAGNCETFVGWNAYGGSNTTTVGTGYYYTNTGDAATLYTQTDNHRWWIAPSGTANNAIAFTQAMTLSAIGNLGLGTTNPAQKLELRTDTTTAGSEPNILINNQGAYSSVTPYSIGGIYGAAYRDVRDPGYVAGINFYRDTRSGGANSAGNIIFYTLSDAGTLAELKTSERARITPSGSAFFNTTSATFTMPSIGGASFKAETTGGGVPIVEIGNTDATTSSDGSPALMVFKNSATTSSSARFIQFSVSGAATTMGAIVGAGSGVCAFANFSDVSLKKNIQPLFGSLAKILALKPSSYDMIADESHVNAGLIAQDVKQVYPEYVIENMSDEGKPPLMGITGGLSGGFISELICAIQEQQAIIASLTARLDAANL